MRWIVGIDFDGRCGGALHMAAWLHEHARERAPQQLVAVHVLDERIRRFLVREAVVDLAPMAVEYMRRLVGETVDPSAFEDVRADWAGSPAEGLALAAATPTVTGIVIGRAANKEARAIERLGRAARRLLRRLPAPVMVVPPDFTRTQVGAGPVLLATDLDAPSVAAGRLARDLAVALDRDLLAVHIDDTLYEMPVIAPEAVIPLMAVPRRSIADLVEWKRTHGLDEAQVHLGEGERVLGLLNAARERDAALVVCGSRSLGLADRIFASSTATELARFADRPVLVVPQ